MNKFLSKKIIIITIVIVLTLLLIVMIYKIFCIKKSNITDLSDEPTQIIFDPQTTYKKALYQLPNNLKILENSDNSTIKPEIKSEIHFLLKTPFFQIKPIITNQKLLKKDIITHYDEGICNSISFKENKADQQINICDQDTDFYNKSKNIKGKSLNEGVLTFTLKNNLFFDNGESINVDTIEHTLRTYLHSKNNLFNPNNKHLFWMGKLKNALNYYKSNKLEKDKKLTCFNKIDNNKFALIFEYDYIKDISLYEIIKNLNQLFLLPQSINELDNYGNSYNDLISYGNYKIDKYVPNLGLLLTNRVDTKLLNIFYLVILQEQDKINLWNNHQLNEMELNENSIKQSLSYDYESSNFHDNEIIGLIANPGNRNDASLYSSRGVSGNHKLCPSIIRDTNFKKVLSTIINKIFFTFNNNNIEDLKIKDVVPFCEDDIKESLKISYNNFISQHPEQNIVEFDLVCENNEKQKELANRLKEEIENLKNIDNRIYFEINIKPVSLKQHVLTEFQKAFDLIITNIKLISNEWEFYLYLLEKLNLETIEFKLSNDEQKYLKQSSIFNNFNLNSLNLEQIKQLITQEDTDESETKCLNSLLKTIKETIKEKNCLFLLSDNKKYIVYQKNINYQSTWVNFLDIVANLFSFQEN